MAEYFLVGDGERSSSSADRMRVSPSSVAQAWLRATRVIPVKFAVGTAYHESGYTLNELDVEPNGHTTGGIFQSDVATVSPLNIGDAAKAAMPDLDIFLLDDACMVFAALCERNLRKILDAVEAYGTPIDRDAPPDDVWAYLFIAHNQGMGSSSSGKGALGTIANYGLDWPSYKARNEATARANAATGDPEAVAKYQWWQKVFRYGDDVISGGPDWREEYASPFDDAGAEIPAPVVSAGSQSQLRLALLALLALLVLALLTGARPGKVLT